MYFGSKLYIVHALKPIVYIIVLIVTMAAPDIDLGAHIFKG